MDSLLKVASFEKKALAHAIKGGIKGGVGAFDKHIFRRGLNLTRPSAQRVGANQWQQYRNINPAYGYKFMGLGAGAYGAHKAYEGIKDYDSGLGEWWDNLNLTPEWARTAWDNKGAIAGTALPVLAFLATRGRFKGKPRSVWPTVAAAAGGGYGGSKLDDWNREDEMVDRATRRAMKEKVINRQRFYDAEGVSRNSEDGSFRPSPDQQYWSEELGRVVTNAQGQALNSHNR